MLLKKTSDQLDQLLISYSIPLPSCIICFELSPKHFPFWEKPSVKISVHLWTSFGSISDKSVLIAPSITAPSLQCLVLILNSAAYSAPCFAGRLNLPPLSTDWSLHLVIFGRAFQMGNSRWTCEDQGGLTRPSSPSTGVSRPLSKVLICASPTLDESQRRVSAPGVVRGGELHSPPLGTVD